MFENIRKNKIKTAGILFIFIIIITVIIYYICMAFDLGYVSIIIALIFSCLSAYLSYYNCDKIVLKMNKARPANENEFKKLNNILDSLIISSGLTTRPQLYIVEDYQPNAFATR